MMNTKLLAVVTPPYINQKLSIETTDYIVQIVEINVLEFINASCCGFPYKILSNKFLDLDKAFNFYFMGTGESFLNCYEFQTLFICYIHLITRFSGVQVQLSWLKGKIFTWKSTSITNMLIHFWIFSMN